eukprot:TRINITY_DN895_c0_g1_i2.p1 TRINITY_DN895_c0_g1~~TRINITY_DN895_c0_g1_i2.p1  ORF type:complete len:181 (+),score=36.41 TRINITY_DN895_c0_g1_i2:271-813(+)
MGCACSGKQKPGALPTFGQDSKVLPPEEPGASQPKPLSELYPARREHFMNEQKRFKEEVESTRARRQAERILQCACPSCRMILGIRADQLHHVGGVVRCGRCSTLFIVTVGEESGGLALPPGIRPNGAAAINTQCTHLSLIHISEPTRLLSISYAVFCLKKKKKKVINDKRKIIKKKKKI